MVSTEQNRDIKINISFTEGDCDDCGSWDGVDVTIEMFGEIFEAYGDTHLGGNDNDFQLDMDEPEQSAMSFIATKLIEKHGYNLSIEQSEYTDD
jgi:hypothetical protein